MNGIQIPTTTTDAVLQLFQAMRDVTQARDALVEALPPAHRAAVERALAEPAGGAP